MKKIAFSFVLSLFLIAIAGSRSDASHPSPGDMGTVISLAGDVYTSANHAYQAAAREAHHYTWQERYALEHLQLFVRDAYHFYNQVQTYRYDPSHTEHDHQRLVSAYYDARSTFYDLHPTTHVINDWLRAEVAMADLMRYYQGGTTPPTHPNPPASAVQISVNRIDYGGNWHTAVARVEGVIYGTVQSAYVYLDGQYIQTLPTNTHQASNSFYVRVSYPRGQSHLLEIRATDASGFVTTWSRYL